MMADGTPDRLPDYDTSDPRLEYLRRPDIRALPRPRLGLPRGADHPRHGGIQGWWSERLWEDCLHVAAAHDNVYLETGVWWAELYDKPLADPNIGPEKLL